MYQPLSPCPACARHVRATEGQCPFCQSPMPEGFSASVRPEAPRRLSRAAALAFGTALALGACSDTVSGTDAGADASPVDARADVVDDDGGPVALYGDPPPPPRDASADTVDDDGGPVAEYGAPPPMDAGVDDGAILAMYGTPPPPDASARDVVDDEGGTVFLYGAPPPPDGGA